MSADPKPVELAEAEREGLIDAIQDGTEAAYVEDLIAAREAAARREALLEAAAHFESEMGPAWGDNRSWFTTGKRVTSLVAEVLRALAEPERDEYEEQP